MPRFTAMGAPEGCGFAAMTSRGGSVGGTDTPLCRLVHTDSEPGHSVFRLCSGRKETLLLALSRRSSRLKAAAKAYRSPGSGPHGSDAMQLQDAKAATA